MSWDVSWQNSQPPPKEEKKSRFSINHDLRCFLKGSCHHCHFTLGIVLWRCLRCEKIHRSDPPKSLSPSLTLVDFRIEREKLLLCSIWKKRWCLFSISFYYFLLFSCCLEVMFVVSTTGDHHWKHHLGICVYPFFAKPWKHLRLPCSKPWFNDNPVMFELCVVAICHCTQPIWLVRSRSFQIIQRYQSLFQ